MALEGNGFDLVPQRPRVPNYYGDSVRAIFLVISVMLIVAESAGATLPLSSAASVFAATALVIAAGVTNPTQKWVHWVNAGFSLFGTLFFGITAVEKYRAGARFPDPSFIFVELIALLSLAALYLSTRTIRGRFEKANAGIKRPPPLP